MIHVRTEDPVVRIVVTEDSEVTRLEVFDSFGLIGFEQVKMNPNVSHEGVK